MDVSLTLLDVVDSYSEYRNFEEDSKSKDLQERIGALFARHQRKRLDTETSGRLEFRMDWGGNEGVNFSGSARGEIRDDKGNQLQVKIEQKSDKTASLTVSGEHKSGENKNDKK